MVSLSAVLPASALVLAALATTQVAAHGYMYIPLAEFVDSTTSAWVVQIDPVFASDDWDGNKEQSVTTWKTLAAENNVTDIRTLLDSDTTLYGADCGFTDPDATAKTPPNDGTATFSRGMVHVGPCEIWLDDTKVLTDDNCYATYGGEDQDVKSIFPIDYSSCSTSGCMLRFYWLAFQGIDSETVWQVYKDCVPLTGPASSDGSSTATTTTSSAASATTSASASTAASATEASASSAASATEASASTTAESTYSSASTEASATEASASTEASAATESTYSSASTEASASTESSATEASASTEADASYASASTEASAAETTTSSYESTEASAATSTESSAAETEAPAATTTTPTATTAVPTTSSSSSDKCNVRARK